MTVQKSPPVLSENSFPVTADIIKDLMVPGSTVMNKLWESLYQKRQEYLAYVDSQLLTMIPGEGEQVELARNEMVEHFKSRFGSELTIYYNLFLNVSKNLIELDLYRQGLHEPKQRDGFPEVSNQVLSHGFSRTVQAMKKREEVGKERYGTVIHTFTNLDYLQEASEELNDAVVYMATTLFEKFHTFSEANVAELFNSYK